VPVPYPTPPEVGVAVELVPPDAIGKVPVVRADVEVAYTAPPEVNDVSPVPPLVVPMVVAFQVPVAMVPTDVSDDKVVTALFTRVPEVGSVTLVAAVEVSVIENAPEVASVLPLVSVRVPVVVVMVAPFTLVAVATPRAGVVNVGLVARTMEPEPVVVLPSAVTVPLGGRVSEVLAPTVRVVVNAPDSVRAPPRVMVDPEALDTPVPPAAAPRVPQVGVPAAADKRA